MWASADPALLLRQRFCSDWMNRRCCTAQIKEQAQHQMTEMSWSFRLVFGARKMLWLTVMLLHVFVSSDIDECAEGLIECHNHSRCVNLPGWYHCECRSGFHDNGSYLLDGSSCIGEHTFNWNLSLLEMPPPLLLCADHPVVIGSSPSLSFSMSNYWGTQHTVSACLPSLNRSTECDVMNACGTCAFASASPLADKGTN